MSKFPISLKKIKGDDWGYKDNLHKIAEYTAIAAGATITKGVYNEDITLTGRKMYTSLDIVNGALLSNEGNDILVFGDCRIRSARLTCANLYVYGDLIVERAAGDESYTNLLTLSGGVYVAGDAVLKNTKWRFGVKKLQRVGGNFNLQSVNTEFTLNNPTPLAAAGSFIEFLVGGDFYYDGAAWTMHGGGHSDNPYSGLGINIRAGGDISLPNLATIDSGGSPSITETTNPDGADGMDIKLSAGGDITFGQTLDIDTAGGARYGNSYYPGVTGDGGDVIFRYGGTLTVTLGTTDYSADDYIADGEGTDGTAGTYQDLPSTIASDYIPDMVGAVTEDGATTDELTWNVPVDPNDDALDFKVEIQERLNEAIWVAVLDQNTNDDAAQFSGTPPYAEGAGTVTYTIPAGLTSGASYSWRVTAMKDVDTALSSMPSEWREFIMA